MRKWMWVSMTIGLHAVIHSQVVIHDTVTVCPDTSSLSGQPAHPLAKSEIHFFYAPVYNPCGELTYCIPGMVDGVIDPCGGGCYTFSRDFSEVTYTSQIRSAVIPLINLSESGGSIAFDVSRPQSEIGHRIFAYHITNRPDLRVCWGADPTIPPTGTGTLNVAYGERLFFALQEDVYSPGHIPLEITPICPYEFMVRFVNPDLTLWVNGFETGMATYEVVPDTDSVAHGTAVPLDVIAWLQREEGTEEIPETAELDFTFMSGAEYGTYIGPDSLQADTLQNILYRDVKAGRVQFIANGDNPEGSELVIFSVNASGKECPAGAGIAFVQPAAEYSFTVTFSRDTITHGEIDTVYIQMVNSTGENMDPPDGTMVLFELDPNGQKYGSLRMPDSSEVIPGYPVSYEDAKQGRITYFADGDEIDSVRNVLVYVKSFENPGFKGQGSLTLTSAPKIEILDKSNRVTGELHIGIWEGAYTKSGGLKNDFIPLDPDCFKIRVVDRSLTTEMIHVRVGVIGDVAEPSNDIILRFCPEMGGYISDDQLLVSHNLDDIQKQNEDDEYAGGKCGEDESVDDRTHQASVGGEIVVFYRNIVKRVKVSPAVKTVHINTWILVEPFEDVGYVDRDGNIIGAGNNLFDYEGKGPGTVHERGIKSERYLDLSSGARKYYSGDDNWIIKRGDGRGAVANFNYVEDQIRRANISWAQAGVRILHNSNRLITDINSANDDRNPLDDYYRKDILADARFSIEEWRAVKQKLYNNGKIGVDDDFVTAVFIINIPTEIGSGFTALTYRGFTPSKGTYHLNINFIDSQNDIRYRTLAHELGHLFCITAVDSLHADRWLFFPQARANYLDEKVNQNRRITRDVMEEVRAKENPLN